MKGSVVATAMAVAAAVTASAAAAADSGRGRALYETRCTGCHATSIHGRAVRIADSCAAVRAQVARWNAHLGSTWSADEIDDVTLFLDERYYRFPVEKGTCATPVAARGAAPRG